MMALVEHTFFSLKEGCEYEKIFDSRHMWLDVCKHLLQTNRSVVILNI